MPEKKKNRRRLFDDKRIVLLSAFLSAFVFWVIVAGFIMPADNRVLSNVKIDYERGSNAYEEMGLQMVGVPPEMYVDVDVRGDGAQLGPLSNSSVTAYMDYSDVKTAGVYEVPVRVAKVSTANFSIYGHSLSGGGHSLEANPKTRLAITFEEVERKTFAVRIEADSVKPAQGFFKDNKGARADPAQVTVTGPKSKVEQIAQVVARVMVQEERSERKLYQAANGEVRLVLLDEAGQTLDPTSLGVSVSPLEVDVEIPVLEIRTISLKVDFIGKPQNLDEDWFMQRISLSDNALQVVGVAAAFENLQTPYPIATFNVAQLGLGWREAINISLPEGLRNHDELLQVTASFNSTGLLEKTFVVGNITVINGPKNTSISPVAKTVTVKIIGDEQQINQLKPEDIMVQVDAFGLSAQSDGQQTMPARVLVPGADRLIPVESYSLVCEVSALK